jgi:hypothetical protein
MLTSLHLVQIVTCSTVDVETLQAFNSSILVIKLAFSVRRREIESLQMLQVFTFFYFKIISIFQLNKFFIFLNEQVLLAFQDIILLVNGFY